MWEAFFLRQRHQRAARDRLSSAVLLAILFTVAFRLQRTGQQWATPADLLHHAVLMGTAVISVVEADSPPYLAWRNIIAVALRLGIASSPVIAKHAELVLQASLASQAHQ